jgi:hypothetical protein
MYKLKLTTATLNVFKNVTLMCTTVGLAAYVIDRDGRSFYDQHEFDYDRLLVSVVIANKLKKFIYRNEVNLFALFGYSQYATLTQVNKLTPSQLLAIIKRYVVNSNNHFIEQGKHYKKQYGSSSYQTLSQAITLKGGKPFYLYNFPYDKETDSDKIAYLMDRLELVNV